MQALLLGKELVFRRCFFNVLVCNECSASKGGQTASQGALLVSLGDMAHCSKKLQQQDNATDAH